MSGGIIDGCRKTAGRKDERLPNDIPPAKKKPVNQKFVVIDLFDSKAFTRQKVSFSPASPW
jgi:hypothetical protein